MCSGSANKWPSSPSSSTYNRGRRRCRKPNIESNERKSIIDLIQCNLRGAKYSAQATSIVCCLLILIDQHHVLTRAGQYTQQNGYQLFNSAASDPYTPSNIVNQQTNVTNVTSINNNSSSSSAGNITCPNGLLTFELATGFIYKPASAETLAMMPSTLQLTDCLDYCLQNSSCLAINFEMGLCVLLSSSAKQNPQNLYSSQFPVFTIYAEKKCLLQGEEQAAKQRHRCQRAWTFERVAGYEMKTKPRRRLKVASKELCMESCLLERDFECRSANWYRLTNECTLSDQDRHSVSQSEAGDQQIKGSLHDLYGPSNLTAPASSRPTSSAPLRLPPNPSSAGSGLYQNYYMAQDRLRLALAAQAAAAAATNLGENDDLAPTKDKTLSKRSAGRSMASTNKTHRFSYARSTAAAAVDDANSWPPAQYVVELPAQAPVDYLENNCVYEPNKLCEFRKIQNRVLKTVDSIYQDIGSLDECKQKCLNAPYRCYSFDYGDTSERVCRTSHLDQASLLSVKEPYLDVVGAITYELASCFNVTIQCRAREMVAQVSSSKMFRGKIYVKSRPSSCVNDIRESLKFELSMKYHDENCDVRASSNSQQGVFSNDIVIQHHDRIVTTQDVGLSVYCQYDLGNRSITNNVNLAIDRIDEAPNMEGKTQPGASGQRPANETGGGSLSSPLTITSLATTVVRSPNVTMRITNMNGQPMTSATVGDRLALLFEIKEKTSPFGIFVREIVAMDGKQLLAAVAANKNNNGNRRGSPASGAYHYGPSYNDSANLLSNESTVETVFQANKGNSIQFIDSDGCPTDANIMGPLVKMDPSGHRVLAPFDAFKFPTSDMVFFRAVVTSCVSECKPVVCPPQPGSGASGGGGGLGRGDSLDQFTTTTEIVTTAATLPAATSTQFDQLVTTTLASTSGRNMIAGLRQQSASVAAATTTTQQPPPSPLTDSPMMITSHHEPPTRRWNTQLQTGGLERFSTAAKEQQRGDSLTTVPGFSSTESPVWQHVNNGLKSNSSRPGDNKQPQTDPSFVETLNEPKRQQLVKLFENKLKQQIGSNYSTASSAQLAADLFQVYKQFTNRKPLMQKSPTEDSMNLMSHHQSRLDGTLTDEHPLIGLSKSLNIEPLDGLLFYVLFRTMDFENKTEAKEFIDTLRTMSNKNQTSTGQSSTFNSKTTTPMLDGLQTLIGVLARHEKNLGQKVKEEPYLPKGAFRSFGKRRRKREVSAEDGRAVEPSKVELISSGFVRLDQEQVAQLAPSFGLLTNPQARFTKSTVEMYHTDLADATQMRRNREKREVQPFYELDELVVQSIKIVDRLHFQDQDQDQTTTNSASARRKPAVKSLLVTKWRNNTDNLMARSLGMLGDNMQSDSLQVDDDSSEQVPDSRPKLVSWSSSGVLSLLIIASTFVFLQILLVLVCLVEWNQRRRRKLGCKKASLVGSSLSRSSTLTSRATDTYCYSTGKVQQTLYAPPTDKISTPMHLYDVSQPQQITMTRAIGRREVTNNSSNVAPMQLASEPHYYDSVCQQNSPLRYQRGNHDDCVACHLPKNCL